MSDTNDGQSTGADDTKSGDTGNTSDEKITVDRSAEEYARALKETSAENKKFRQKASTLQQQMEERDKELKALRDEKLQKDGQWQKMYETEKEQRSKLETDLKKSQANFAFKAVTSEFSAAAQKAGCNNVGDLIKLASADGIISELEVSNEDYSITPETLKAGVERAQKQYAYLFSKTTPRISDGVPNGKDKTATGKKDLTTMKMEDLIAMAKSATN